MKPMGRCFVSALLIFAMLLGGCASAVSTEGTTEPPVTDAPATEAPTTEAPATEATEATTDEALAEARRRENLPEVVRELEDFLPELVGQGNDVAQIGQAIDEKYGEQKADDGTFVLEQDDMHSYSFAYWVSGDILSVVVRDASVYVIEDRTGFDIGDYYFVYTLHISDGTPATQDELLKLAGVTEEEFYQRVTVAAGDAACTFFPDTVIEEYLAAKDPSTTLPVESFRASIAEESVYRAVPYLDDEGKLWFTAKISHLVAAGIHMVLRPYDQTEPLSPYYDRIRALAAEVTAKE